MKRFFLLTSFGCLTAVFSHAQIANQTNVQAGANFNIGGTGTASRFITSSTSDVVHYLIQQTTANRWGLGMANQETGGAGYAGSNFAIYAYDGGTFLGRYFTIMRNNGFTGINNISPTAQLHVSTAKNIPLARFTCSSVPEVKAALTLSNTTGADTSFLPCITGRGYSPGRPIGLSIIGEAEDLAPTANEPYSAAIMLDARSKTTSRLYSANLFAVNTYGVTMFMIKGNGNVGIGTTNPGTNRLAVEGTIAARRMKVTQNNPWPDYVFEQDYPLPSLSHIEAFVKENKHLPEVPSAKEIAANGQDLGEMNAVLLKKVEELTLHLIAMQKEIAEVKAANVVLGKEMTAMKAGAVNRFLSVRGR